MRRIPIQHTMRLMLAVSAACAVSACAAGTQQSLPTTNSGLTPQASSRLTAASLSERSSSSERRDAEGGDDGNGTVVYSSIPKPLKAVASVGFEAYQGLELGDGVNLTHTGKLQRVRYVLSSWGCQRGHWNSNDCSTTPGATFPVPITINVYAVSNSNVTRVGALLKSQTRTFNVPYRPSADPRCTGTSAGKFYSAVDARCVNGLANVIVFDFTAPRVSLPLQSIFSLVYNTSHYGPTPVGESAACYTSSGGCGYDSLNISTDGPGGPIGSPVDPNGIFDNYTQRGAGNSCAPYTNSGFRLDTGPGCWTTNHPQFEVRVGGGGGDDNDNHREGHDD